MTESVSPRSSFEQVIRRLDDGKSWRIFLLSALALGKSVIGCIAGVVLTDFIGHGGQDEL